MNKKTKKIFLQKKVFRISAFVFLAFLLQFPVRGFVSQKISEKGNYYFNGGDYNLEKAENLYKTALKINGNNWTARYQLARIDLINSRFANGVSEIDKALAIDPENKRAFYVRGLLDGYAGNYSEAEKDFQNFIAWSPNEWAGYMDLSWVYINSQKYDEAVAISGNGLVLFPDNVWLMANKGLAEYKLGRYDEAKNNLENAKKLAEDLTPEDWKRAYPGNDSGGAEKGVEEIQTAIDYNLNLVYLMTDGENEISKIAFSDIKELSKYSGSSNLIDGVTLSACAASTYSACSGKTCLPRTCTICNSIYDTARAASGAIPECCVASSCSTDYDCGKCTKFNGAHK